MNVRKKTKPPEKARASDMKNMNKRTQVNAAMNEALNGAVAIGKTVEGKLMMKSADGFGMTFAFTFQGTFYIVPAEITNIWRI
jgi:hypothetical protein